MFETQDSCVHAWSDPVLSQNSNLADVVGSAPFFVWTNFVLVGLQNTQSEARGFYIIIAMFYNVSIPTLLSSSVVFEQWIDSIRGLQNATAVTEVMTNTN